MRTLNLAIRILQSHAVMIFIAESSLYSCTILYMKNWLCLLKKKSTEKRFFILTIPVYTYLDYKSTVSKTKLKEAKISSFLWALLWIAYIHITIDVSVLCLWLSCMLYINISLYVEFFRILNHVDFVLSLAYL